MIDETELEAKVKTLWIIEDSMKTLAKKAAQTRAVLKTIERTESGASPTDSRTGQTMSDATRQEIYDANVIVANELITQYNSLVD